MHTVLLCLCCQDAPHGHGLLDGSPGGSRQQRGGPGVLRRLSLRPHTPLGSANASFSSGGGGSPGSRLRGVRAFLFPFRTIPSSRVS